jgi:hypothetical protein
MIDDPTSMSAGTATRKRRLADVRAKIFREVTRLEYDWRAYEPTGEFSEADLGTGAEGCGAVAVAVSRVDPLTRPENAGTRSAAAVPARRWCVTFSAFWPGSASRLLTVVFAPRGAVVARWLFGDASSASLGREIWGRSGDTRHPEPKSFFGSQRR